MTDEPKDLPELSELEPLEELPELEDLEPMPELTDLEELPAEVVPEQSASTASKVPAKQAPAKKVPAKKAPIKQAPAKKAAVKKAEAKKAESSAVAAKQADAPVPAPAASADKSSGPGDAPLDEIAGASTSAGDVSAAKGASKDGDGRKDAAAGGGQKRELEQAPIELRKAAMILAGGAILPFSVSVGGPDIPWAAIMAGKAVALIAAWLLHQGALASHGGQAVGFMTSIAKIHKMAAPAIFGILAIAAFVVPYMMWPILESGDPQPGSWRALVEIMTLLLATSTITHIYSYEHGGKFNPLFPLMFLGPGIAGVLGTFNSFSNNPIGGLGNLIVALGGLMAIHVMYVSMKQAKIEGDIKREVMRQARKAQREASRGTKGAGSKKD